MKKDFDKLKELVYFTGFKRPLNMKAITGHFIIKEGSRLIFAPCSVGDDEDKESEKNKVISLLLAQVDIKKIKKTTREDYLEGLKTFIN